jgi:hypothetical protein
MQSQSFGICREGPRGLSPCPPQRPVMVVARCYRSIGWATLAFERGFPAIALDVHLQDRSVVHEPIDGRQRHGLVGENLARFAERLVGRDEQGSAFIERAAISSNSTLVSA